MSFKKWIILSVGCAFLSGCASSAMKNRKEQQVKLSQSSKLYCEFLSGSIYHDVDVVLNLEMAKRCDSDKTYTITQYKTQTEDNGIIYCCTLTGGKSMAKAEFKKPVEKPAEKPADKPEDKKVQEEIE